MTKMVKLSQIELESYRGQGPGKTSGNYLRYYCPLHGGDQQRSLSLNPENGHFKCFNCGVWGYLEEHQKQWASLQKEKKQREKKSDFSSPPISKKISEPPNIMDLENILKNLQQNLPGSWGEKYLQKRCIPLELAQVYGVGYAPSGEWPHLKDGKPVRQWRWGRLVFPHTNPSGKIVNLYGRAVGSQEVVQKSQKHDHLPGAKGVFNAQALATETVFICEGVFDALSLIAAGYQEACAIFGVYSLPWEWTSARRLVFCMDQDEAGENWRELARDGILLGKEIYWLPAEVYV